MEEKTTLHPAYELRAMNHGIDDLELALWQMPSPATPHIVKPLRIARLRGRNLALVEGQILRTLKNAGVHPAPQRGEQQSFSLEEEVALNLGLLCRVLAPMRNAERMPMAEASYWLGMAMHRENPRRVLSALRLLLTDAKA